MICRPTYLTTLLLSATLFLSSCSSGHLTGNPAGPVVGAAVTGGGAALFGAPQYVIALSAIGGGALGYYLTTRQFKSRDLRANGGQVFVQGDYVTINLPVDSTFEANSADLLPGAIPALKNAANILSSFPNDNITVSGNSSGFGLPKSEQKLSAKRAKVVRDFLRDNGISPFKQDGVTHRQLIYIGYGHDMPIANDIKANSIRQNSRIQIIGYPNNQVKKPHIDNISKDKESLPRMRHQPDISHAFSTGSTQATPRFSADTKHPWKGDASR